MVSGKRGSGEKERGMFVLDEFKQQLLQELGQNNQ
jgi:hypothetical protein